jgi:hypothetical protein
MKQRVKKRTINDQSNLGSIQRAGIKPWYYFTDAILCSKTEAWLPSERLYQQLTEGGRYRYLQPVIRQSLGTYMEDLGEGLKSWRGWRPHRKIFLIFNLSLFFEKYRITWCTLNTVTHHLLVFAIPHLLYPYFLQISSPFLCHLWDQQYWNDLIVSGGISSGYLSQSPQDGFTQLPQLFTSSFSFTYSSFYLGQGLYLYSSSKWPHLTAHHLIQSESNTLQAGAQVSHR